MFDPASEPSFRLDIAGQPHPLDVLAFTGHESISEPFAFDLELLVNDPDLDLAGLLYRSAYLQFSSGRGGVHGQIHEVVQREQGVSPSRCRVRLGPRLACLALRFSQRIFTGLPVPEILRQVLDEHGIRQDECRFELQGDYPVREVCSQYRESDLQFLQRLCAEEKIHFHFRHRKTGHRVVFADRRQSFRRGACTVFRGEDKHGAIRQLKVLAKTAGVGPQAQGESDLPGLRSGLVLPLAGHPLAHFNRLWLLTRVDHQGGQPQALEYRNRFQAIPLAVPFVVNGSPVKPRMSGVQRAWRVDAEGDEPGRVAVQFDWVYQGEGAKPSHCWLAAPVGSGAELNRGDAVLVGYAEDDPDRPFIHRVFQDVAAPAAPLLQASISQALLTDDRPRLQLSSGLALTFEADSELLFTVGDSAIRFSGNGLELSSAHISLVAQEPVTASSATTSPDCGVDTGADHEGLRGLVQASHPLVLLCLLPEGGSFEHCSASVCTCRLLARSSRSAAR
ncbi:contractile injection system protein, VgrG/Pvc8 family [Pseudomonas purpurea]|uniref:type VI secretion system Vgr family protein n=1 Tax=Pseudomonas purpurea TaxID=3136737 RepID=UPI003266319A